MAVANNLSYQVLVSPESGGAVKLASKNTNGAQEDDGFYRKVQGFSFARTSSPDGKTFYFKKNDGTSNYRVNDTTDINTTYTYLDFEIKNTTGTSKQFCFRNIANLFEYRGNLTGEDASLDETYKNIILDAMRISIQVEGEEKGQTGDSDNPTDPLIVSRNPQTYNPVDSLDGRSSTTITYNNTNSTAVRYHSMKYHEYIPATLQQPNPEQHPLFISNAEDRPSGEAVDRVSVRIWFDEKDKVYAGLDSEAKKNCDKALEAADITVNFSLVSDTIDYDAIYFDDYAFSNKVGSEGKFVTDEKEADGYSVYLHAFSNKESGDGFKNFKMTKTSTNETPANRWVVSVPLDYVVNGDGDEQNYLTKRESTAPTKWDDTYFYYGNADGTEILYKWNFSNLPANKYLEVVDDTDPESGYSKKLSDRSSYFRNLGVVRDSSNHNSDDEPIVGFLQYDRYDGDNPMQLTYVRDEATALTGEAYNTSAAEGALNYQYISAEAQKNYNIQRTVQKEVSGGDGTVSFDYSALINKLTNGGGVGNLTEDQLNLLDRITYFDVPSGWNLIFRSYNDTNNHTSDTDQKRATGQTCYYVGNFTDGQIQTLSTAPNIGYGVTLDSTYLPASSSTDGWVRVYFFKSTQLDGTDQYKWGDYTVHRVRITVSSYNNQNAWVDDRYGITITQGQTPENGSAGFSLKDAIVNGDGVSTYTDKNGGSGGGTVIETETLYQRYKGGLYLNLRNSDSYESSAMKTISTYYDPESERFMAYVPQPWLTGGMDVHYNELSGYYDVDSDKLRWTTGAASADSENYTYTLLGYTDEHTVAELNSSGVSVGSGVGTWDTVRRIEYNTELLYTGIGSDYVYKTGVSENLYPMVPYADDDLYYKFFAFVPITGLDAQHSNHNLRFKRFVSYQADAGTGIWYPQEDVTEREMTYYAVDSAAGENGAVSANRGWFHVAVFVDGTFDNIVYDTLCNAGAVNGASLTCAQDNGTTAELIYNNVVTASVSGNSVTTVPGTNVTQIGNSRWVVPLSNTTKYVHFRWTPYPATNTQFEYEVDLSKGIYCVVTEADS